MSSPAPIAATGQAAAPVPVRQAIANAAQESGMDFDYLLAQARMESALDPAAKARTSSATGLYQFIDRTWLDMVSRHGEPALRTKLGDSGTRAQILAMRHDPALSSSMAAALANENRDALRSALGREPDHAELYLAHFLGAGGATRVLSADPAANASAILPQAASANRAIFYHASGAPRSVGELIETVRGRMDAAKAQDRGAAPAPVGGGYRQIPSGSQSGSASAPRTAPPGPPADRPGMAEVLRSTFAERGEGFSPAGQERVTRAYRQLHAMGF